MLFNKEKTIRIVIKKKETTTKTKVLIKSLIQSNIFSSYTLLNFDFMQKKLIRYNNQYKSSSKPTNEFFILSKSAQPIKNIS